MTRSSGAKPDSSDSHSSIHRDPSLGIALAGAALAVRQWALAPPLWLDEAMVSLNIRDRGFHELAGALWLGQSAPLGWLALQRLMLVTFGTGERALRFMPLAFGIATLGAAVWVGRRWLGRWSATLLVFLCVLGQWLMYFRVGGKHYSADTFWALLLPALAAWAIEGRETHQERRWVVWWVVAAVGQWFANGAIFVTPGCAAVMAVVITWRDGVRGAVRFAVPGFIWAIAFGAHYEAALRYSYYSAYLRSYWAGDLPPGSLDMLGTIGWLVQRLAPLAHNPGGVSIAPAMWLCASAGFVFGSRRLLGALFATVPVAAFSFAAIGAVPLRERLALWIVPALYVGVALAFDRGVHELSRRRMRLLLPCAGLVLLSLVVAADVAKRGWLRVHNLPDAISNQGMDDRSAARWLMQRRRPGDAILTTRAGWPGIWWYGGIDLRSFPRDSRLPDGTVMYRLDETQDCAPALDEVLKQHRRALIYVGFLDLPREFHDELMADLSAIGTVTESARFADQSRVALVELDQLPRGAARLRGVAFAHACVTATPATLW